MSDGPSMPYTSVPPFLGVCARARLGAPSAAAPAAPAAAVRRKSRRLTPSGSIRIMRSIFEASIALLLGSTRGLPARARVEGLAQAVSNEVEGERRDHDDDAGNGRHVGRAVEHEPAVADHDAPVGRRR